MGGFEGFRFAFPFKGMTTTRRYMSNVVEAQFPAKDSTIQQDAVTWDDFWLLWPKKVAKRDAHRAWNKLTEVDRLAAVIGLASWRKVWEFKASQREDAYDFVPHPATWLNGWRWEDEIPHQFRAGIVRPEGAGRSELHTGSNPDTLPSPTPMPEYVKALLAKLKHKTL